MTYATFTEGDLARWDHFLGNLPNNQFDESAESLPDIEVNISDDAHQNETDQENIEEIEEDEENEDEENNNHVEFENAVDQSDDSIVFFNVSFMFNVNTFIR